MLHGTEKISLETSQHQLPCSSLRGIYNPAHTGAFNLPLKASKGRDQISSLSKLLRIENTQACSQWVTENSRSPLCLQPLTY